MKKIYIKEKTTIGISNINKYIKNDNLLDSNINYYINVNFDRYFDINKRVISLIN